MGREFPWFPQDGKFPKLGKFPNLGNSRTGNSRREKFEAIREGGNGNFLLNITDLRRSRGCAPNHTTPFPAKNICVYAKALLPWMGGRSWLYSRQLRFLALVQFTLHLQSTGQYIIDIEHCQCLLADGLTRGIECIGHCQKMPRFVLQC